MASLFVELEGDSMAHTPAVPPHQIQPLISNIPVQISCAKALESEIYVGGSNGELIRFALQADDPNEPPSYSLLSRQPVLRDRRIDDIVLIPSISRALVLTDHQIHFYTLPTLNPLQAVIKPIRNVVTLAVDHQHMNDAQSNSGELVHFCVIKRANIGLYSLHEKLGFLKELPLPGGVSLAQRTGQYVCIADSTTYSIIDLANSNMTPIIPLSQDPDVTVRPSIVVVSPAEFLVLSWNGVAAMGIFVNGNGDPVRGTLEWQSYPKSICLDFPHVAALLPNDVIEIHNLETLSIVQAISPSASPSTALKDPTTSRLLLALCPNDFLVPVQQSNKLQKKPFPLVRAVLDDKEQEKYRVSL